MSVNKIFQWVVYSIKTKHFTAAMIWLCQHVNCVPRLSKAFQIIKVGALSYCRIVALSGVSIRQHDNTTVCIYRVIALFKMQGNWCSSICCRYLSWGLKDESQVIVWHICFLLKEVFHLFVYRWRQPEVWDSHTVFSPSYWSRVEKWLTSQYTGCRRQPWVVDCPGIAGWWQTYHHGQRHSRTRAGARTSLHSWRRETGSIS